MQQHDILILGGGPSGLSTALHLARDFPHLTSRILILEKEHYPRVKLCAGGLVADAEVILEGLGLDVTEVPHVDVDTAHFDFAGRGISLHIPGTHAIRVIRRNEFDAWLAEKARERGIEIREGIKVREVRANEDHVTVETDAGTFEALIVVGADGSNGVTRRSILPHAPIYTARALEVLTPANDLAPAPGKADHHKDHAYFDFFPVPDNIAGYTWDFPTQVNGQAMRCWGIYDTNLLAGDSRPALKEVLAQELERHGFDLDSVELKGHPIRWFSPENQMAVPRVLLVGDAVGADPIFGEGISIALGYGAVAAKEIGESFRRDQFSFKGYKARVLRSALGQTLLSRWFLAQVIYLIKWRWFQILLWRLVKPVVVITAWIFVLNWGRRLRS
ncbi:MAG: NAD(P)/FAD-dependent oxidoreductase [Chloroflexi bacterium]|nr:NAD(P)/FAD-dependent oxidoreductase [Chloroflexota bacterium]